MSQVAVDRSTTAYLHAHGLAVSPKELDHLVVEAIDRLWRDLYRSDSRRELSEEEVRILESGSFDLEPVDLGAEDPWPAQQRSIRDCSKRASIPRRWPG